MMTEEDYGTERLDNWANVNKKNKILGMGWPIKTGGVTYIIAHLTTQIR